MYYFQGINVIRRNSHSELLNEELQAAATAVFVNGLMGKFKLLTLFFIKTTQHSESSHPTVYLAALQTDTKIAYLLHFWHQYTGVNTPVIGSVAVKMHLLLTPAITRVTKSTRSDILKIITLLG